MSRFSQTVQELLLLEAESHAGRAVISQVAKYSTPLQAHGDCHSGFGAAGGQLLQLPQCVGQSAAVFSQEMLYRVGWVINGILPGCF